MLRQLLQAAVFAAVVSAQDTTDPAAQASIIAESAASVARTQGQGFNGAGQGTRSVTTSTRTIKVREPMGGHPGTTFTHTFIYTDYSTAGGGGFDQPTFTQQTFTQPTFTPTDFTQPTFTTADFTLPPEATAIPTFQTDFGDFGANVPTGV